MAGSSHVHSGQSHQTANAGPNQQHRHKKPRGNCAASCPGCTPKVEDQHDQKRSIAKLPMRPSRKQVPDRILPCGS